jgi:hypothetical protein
LENIFKREYGTLPGEIAKIFKSISLDEGKRLLYEYLCALKSKIMTIDVL